MINKTVSIQRLIYAKVFIEESGVRERGKLLLLRADRIWDFMGRFRDFTGFHGIFLDRWYGSF